MTARHVPCECPDCADLRRRVMSAASDRELAHAVIEAALFIEVNGGELEPIWDVYMPEGVAIVIVHALEKAELL